MYPLVTSDFLQALRQSHTLYVRVDAYRGGVQLGTSDGIPADYARYGLPVTDGTVSVSSGVGVRRSLDITISDSDLWDVLAPLGTELRVERGIRYPNGEIESIPLGQFCVDSQSMSVAPGGGLRLSPAPDRWARIQRARFKSPAASVVGAQVRYEIQRLLEEAISGLVVTVTATSTVTVKSLVWERDRAQALADLAASISAEVYFDWTGNAVVRDAPLLSAVPVWTVDASASGVLIGGDRSRDRTRTYNVVVVNSSSVDGSTPFAQQIVSDTDPTSPTNTTDMGEVPYFYSSPLIATTAQALAAGATILNRVKALNAQLNVEAAVNPALDRGDVIYVLTSGQVIERHLVESFTVPLVVGGTQTITTRSSRPDGDVPDEE